MARHVNWRAALRGRYGIGRAAAWGLTLYGRAFGRPIRTEDATVARLRREDRAAAAAFVEEDARVGGHLLDGRFTAFRTGQG